MRQPQQIILLSPMIGVTAFARFAGLAGLPSVFPAFARAARLNVAPEFNPFKVQLLSGQGGETIVVIERALQQQIIRAARQGELKALPPILTFQSVMDSTVSTARWWSPCIAICRITAASWWCSILTGRRISGSCFALRSMRR